MALCIPTYTKQGARAYTTDSEPVSHLLKHINTHMVGRAEKSEFLGNAVKCDKHIKVCRNQDPNSQNPIPNCYCDEDISH